MQFQIVELTPSGPVPVADLGLFNDGDEAARAALTLANVSRKKYQPRPVVSADWRKREADRFQSGEYKHLPWVNESWWTYAANPDHFAHVSVKNPGKVAYTENPQKGEADRQTVVSAGRYLTRFFSNVLSPRQIRDIATRFNASEEVIEVKFAKTPDEIEEVYRYGPTSCMAGSSCRQARAYGSGDFAVAYIERNGKITGRVVCCPDRKIVADEAYGDRERIYRAMLDLDYRRTADRKEWVGLRLLDNEADQHGYPYPDFGYTILRSRDGFSYFCAD